MSRFFTVFAALWLAGNSAAAGPPDNDPRLAGLRLPAGFRIAIYADGVAEARSLALGDDGTVYVGSLDQGKVYAVQPDRTGDGKSDGVNVIAAGLDTPNGVAFLKGDLYVAETPRILRFKDIARQPQQKPQTVYDRLPTESHHGSRYLRAGPDGKLYVSVGAPCNICDPGDPYAALARLDADGSHFEIIARGIRNTVGFDWQPGSGELWFTDNGRDWLGDDRPPEELNRLPRPGLHFGYPYCHAGDILDPQFGKDRSCSDFTPPAWKFLAHVAPLGMRFYDGTQFPAEYREQLFVAQHGSWNRSRKQGYQVRLVRFANGKPVADQPFIEGWLDEKEKVHGRPVDVLPMPDGALLVSDDLNGVLYRVRYEAPAPR
ncbi:MAG TPA: PQQ-dependent sugar dehydrogenase [Methylococcaceae bacterium]|nr:PQQ-dependent sugar dehydrogenase [Methylococcaceae bacterium]